MRAERAVHQLVQRDAEQLRRGLVGDDHAGVVVDDHDALLEAGEDLAVQPLGRPQRLRSCCFCAVMSQ